MFKLPPTSKRVLLHTNNFVNKKIAIKTIKDIIKYKHASIRKISKRLNQLDCEWDTERVLETNAAALIFITTVLGMCKSRKWLILTCTISLFLLQHALQGWCPPLSIIRRLGIRTIDEINNERLCLKFYRGDFKNVKTN